MVEKDEWLTGNVRKIAHGFSFVLLVLFAMVSSDRVANATVDIVDARMPINKDLSQVDTSSRGVVLFSLRLAQADFKGVPELSYVLVRALDDTGKSTSTGFRIHAEKDYRSVYTNERKYRDYLVSMQLEPGNYRIAGFAFETKTSKTVQVEGSALAVADFRVLANKVTYLGSLQATMRSRKCGEFKIIHRAKSGATTTILSSVVPLLDLVVEGVTSSALGYDSGTFDFDAINNIDRDLAVLRAEYPVLKNLTVEAGAMLAFKKLSPEQIAAVCAKEQNTSP